jgi:hypothetical protein
MHFALAGEPISIDRPSRGNETILLVKNAGPLRDVTREFLKEAECVVLETNDVLDALETLPNKNRNPHSSKNRSPRMPLFIRCGRCPTPPHRSLYRLLRKSCPAMAQVGGYLRLLTVITVSPL